MSKWCGPSPTKYPLVQFTDGISNLFCYFMPTGEPSMSLKYAFDAKDLSGVLVAQQEVLRNAEMAADVGILSAIFMNLAFKCAINSNVYPVFHFVLKFLFDYNWLPADPQSREYNNFASLLSGAPSLSPQQLKEKKFSMLSKKAKGSNKLLPGQTRLDQAMKLTRQDQSQLQPVGKVKPRDKNKFTAPVVVEPKTQEVPGSSKVNKRNISTAKRTYKRRK